MMSTVCRYLLVLAACLGIIAPKFGAAVITMTPGVTSAVICTGSGLVVISDLPGDVPTQMPHQLSDMCVTVDSDAEATAPPRLWTRVVASFAYQPVAVTGSAHDLAWPFVTPSGQGPPVSIW